MLTDERINMLARVARAPRGSQCAPTTAGAGEGSEGDVVRSAAPGKPGERSILTLAAASYGSRPDVEVTVPTGFDPLAAALFETIVEAAYLVATADGVFDEDEQRTFERIVIAACGGMVAPSHVASLVSDLGDQLAEDGLDRRIRRLSENVARREHAEEVIRIAALIARCSEDVSDVERATLDKLAVACKLASDDVEAALAEAERALMLMG